MLSIIRFVYYLKNLNKILNRPFPIIQSTKEKIISAVVFGAFIFLFLAIFQPFGLNNFEGNKLLYFGGYGFITTFVILFNVFIIMNLFKEFFSYEKWNLWKSFVQNSLMIIPIAILNWIYFIYADNTPDLDYSFLTFIFMTIAVGFFPSVLFVYYLEQKLRMKNLQLSEKVNRQLTLNSADNSKTVELNFVSQNSSIKISINDFLCIKSMGNYVTLFFMNDQKLRKEIIRTTMKKIEENFLNHEKIIRCHKSYFVNMNKVKTTSGNARALYLHVEGLDFPVPVSRKFSKTIISGTV